MSDEGKVLFKTTITPDHILGITSENLAQFNAISDPFWQSNVRSQLAIIAWNRYDAEAYEHGMESKEWKEYARNRAITEVDFTWDVNSMGMQVTIWDKEREKALVIPEEEIESDWLESDRLRED